MSAERGYVIQNVVGIQIEHIYELAIYGRIAEIEAALQSFSRSARLHDPGALALRSAKAVLTGNAPSGVALLERALHLPESPSSPYLADLLVPHYITSGQIGEASALIEKYREQAEGVLIAAFLAVRAIVAARLGDDVQSREISKQALRLGRALDNPVFGARIMQRTALAAFFRQDYDEAQDRALESARSYEQEGAYRGATVAYSILYLIAQDWAGDPDVARFYAERISICGHRAGDVSMENFGLVAQLNIAAEAGDQRRFGSLRARLLANPVNEQYKERFSYVIAEALSNAWAGRFESARFAITSLKNVEDRSLPERALCHSILAIISVALGNAEEVRRHSRLAISLSSSSGVAEPLYDSRHRRIARLVAAAACFLGGDPTRGRRALSRSFDPDQRFARIISSEGMLENETPALMRGFARMINSARLTARTADVAHGLTPTELVVLRVLPEGQTLSCIASELNKSKKTIERHVGSIYQKLHVSNRAQAIRRARDLGIHA